MGDRMTLAAKAALVSLLGSIAFAQTEAPGKVLIPVIVEDSRHRPVNGLTASSLIFSEHKTALTEFSLLPAMDLPLELGIVIDASGSEHDRHLQDILTTMLKFAKEMVRGPEDRVFFLRFNVTSEMTPWLKQEQLANFILKVDIGGGTALHDAVATACRERLGPRDWNKPTRRVLVVFSDGEDNQSHLTHSEASADALKSGAMMFTLTQEIHPDGAKGDRNMRDWAMITGGRFFSGVNRKDAPQVFAQIKELLDSMYIASFVPPASTNKTHQIEVKPSEKEKWELSFPKAYFWP